MPTRLKSVTASSSLLHGNGGNDSFYLTAEAYGSTVYGGQGADLISQTGTNQSITASWIAGNRGSDKIVLNAATTVLNSTILGSDIGGTISGNDSLSLAATTIQTSTVFGGAGNDTIILGGTNANTQIIEGDFNAFAGSDTLSIVGSFVSSTINAGAGNDTLFLNTSSAGLTASTATSFYAGTGADKISAANAVSVSIFADSSATDTAGGADAITLGTVSAATVYGAAGADTLQFDATQTSLYADLGTGVGFFTGTGGITASTLIGGASADTFSFGAGITSTSITGGEGASSIALAATLSSSTITGGSANDTFA